MTIPLTAREIYYVDRVAASLEDLPRGVRERLLDSLRQNLVERRATVDAPEEHQPHLDAELGTPAEYAAELLAEAERARPGFTTRARRQRRWQIAAILAAWVLVLGSGLGGFAWWMTWNPGFHAPSGRICMGQPGVDRCETDGITDLTPADMVQISCEAGRTLDIGIGIFADRAVTVTGASIIGGVGIGNMRPDGSPFSTQTFRLTAIEPWVRPTPTSDYQPSTWPIKVDRSSLLPEVHFVMDLCPRDGGPPPMQIGGSLIMESFELHYRALGRDHVATVPFTEAIAITRLP